MRMGLLVVATFMSGWAQAQMTPVGQWRSIDDATGEAKAEIHIVEQAGVLSARVVRSLRDKPNARKNCDDCVDDRKGQPIIGMEGKEYTVRLVPLEDGKRLQVRGYIGPFYRTQIWQRMP